nr:hypothetical protein [Tanacetum cinerariifolium]
MDFLGPAPSYVYIRDPMRILCHRMISCSISGRGKAPEKVTGIDLFYLRSIDLRTANISYLLAQYLFRHAARRKSEARLSGGYFIRCLAAYFVLVGDEGLMGLSMITPGDPEDAEGTHDEIEGDQAILAPMQVPQPPLTAAQTEAMPQRIARVEEEVRELRQSIMRLHGVIDRSITDQSRFPTRRKTGDTNTSAP